MVRPNELWSDSKDLMPLHRAARRRFRVVAPRICLPVGGALLLCSIVGAGFGLPFDTYSRPIAFGSMILLAGVAQLSFPIPPPGESEPAKDKGVW